MYSHTRLKMLFYKISCNTFTRTKLDHALMSGFDKLFFCSRCSKYWKTGSRDDCRNLAKSPTKLHTLHHGCIRIHVQDNMCVSGNAVRYEGFTDKIFCATRFQAFTRELLEAWVFDFCGLGMTFREAFTSWKRKACSTSGRAHYVDEGVTCKRRMGNDAFTRFVRMLVFPSKEKLLRLFSCKSCSKIVTDGHSHR